MRMPATHRFMDTTAQHMASKDPMPTRPGLFRPLADWLPPVSEPLVIAGPCSAESRAQLLRIAGKLKETGLVTVLRAGIWKARTRPGMFEGKGEEALRWLGEARAQSGLKTAVEVAAPAHVEACLKHRVDMVWIGARTGVNPFAVQELAHALKNTDMGVLVKNPLNPDIDGWTGIIERLLEAGLDRILAVHRGFSTFAQNAYRNTPLWEIPIELRRRFPDLPLLCDPSHIAGQPGMLLHTAQHAMDLDMNGLMIEVHPRPGKALSDARQQITPAGLKALVSHLVMRQAQPGGTDISVLLQALRRQIDEIDQQLIEFIARRMEVAGRIGRIKKEQEVTILQIERWCRLCEDRLQQARLQGLDTRFIKRILEMIHEESIRRQQAVMNPDKKTPEQPNTSLT